MNNLKLGAEGDPLLLTITAISLGLVKPSTIAISLVALLLR